MKNKIFIATSLDGFIADRNGGIDWLTSVPPLPDSDMGFSEFMASVDAVLMGRNTFETVLGFEMDWMYTKPVYVWTSQQLTIPENLKDKVFLIKGELQQVIQELEEKGIAALYVDGGKTIQSFLNNNQIHEMIITLVPIVLGGGTPLFGDLEKPMQLQLRNTQKFDNQLVQISYLRV